VFGQHLAQGLNHAALQVCAVAVDGCGWRGMGQNCGHGGLTFRDIDWAMTSLYVEMCRPAVKNLGPKREFC